MNRVIDRDRLEGSISFTTPAIDWFGLFTGGSSKKKMPKRYIINKDATILFWDENEKTIVKRAKDDEFNKRLGFLTAYFQYHSGLSKTKANKFLDELEVED